MQVLYARDKWLVKGGAILPDRATLSLCAIEDGEYKVGGWGRGACGWVGAGGWG